MSSIDERVVSMKFDNAGFEQGIKQTLASLDALSKGLKLEGATKGLTDIGNAGKNFSLSHVASAVDGIADHFKAMSIVAITALANVANRAVDAGITVIKSLTVSPINAGLQEYQTNINSIQTILSNTRWQHTGLDDVIGALDTLNVYSDKTIYNFSQMARNIGTFTAAGVKLGVAVDAIKGIANLAAVSGSNAEQASSAMYQLSQAIATGTVKLIDWNSVVNAGLGGKVFQDALIETARVHGVAVDKIIKEEGSFRASLQTGWLSASILTETLSHFTGDLTKAQLISSGYTQKQADAIIAMGKDANEAATKVKTITQLLNTLQESAGSGWAKTWQLIFGDFDEARNLFTNVNDVLGAFIQTSADSRNKILSDWKELGGRTVLIEAISNAFHALMAVLDPIRRAFREIFPKTTGQDLYNIVVAIRDFTKTLMIGGQTAENLRRTFAGFFAVLGIGYEIIKQVAKAIFELLGFAFEGSGGILEFTANVGDFLVALHTAVKEGDGLTQFFHGLVAVLKVPIKLIQALGVFLAALFDPIDTDKATKAIGDFGEKLNPFVVIGNTIEHIWKKIVHSFDEAWGMFEPLASQIGKFFNNFGSDVAKFTEGFGLQDIIAGVNTGLLGYLVISLTTLFGQNGIISNARKILDNVNDTLNTMQNTLRAATLLQIAVALGILALAVNTLSKIDSAGLTRALSALTVMFTELLASLALISSMPGANLTKLYAVTGSMILLGLAVKTLASAIKDLADVDPKALHKGLIAVLILLGAITAAGKALPPSASLVSTGLGLLILAAGIKVLASAVLDLKDISWEEMTKGLVGVGTLLGALTLFTRFAKADATGVLSGAGIVLLAAGIKILASAIKDISGISWENVGKGMATIAVSLGLIGTALYLIPPTAPLQAAGIVLVATAMLILGQAMQTMSGISWENAGKGMAIVATSLALIAGALLLIPPTAPLSAAGVLIVALALEILADVLKKMSGMSWPEFAKSMTVMATALAIISAAMLLMPAAIPGALALLIVANALVVLTGVLIVLGNMSWEHILKGLGALALAFVVLGVASAALQPVIPAMLGLGAALVLIGLGVALAGAGVFLLATGLTALSVAGAAGTAAIVAFVAGIIGLIPLVVQQLGVVLLLVIDFLIVAAPKIVKLLVDIFVQLLEALDKQAPLIEKALLKLIILLINVLKAAVPRLYVAGLEVLYGILSGIRDNIGRIVTVALDIVAEFLKAIGKRLPVVIDAGFQMIISFINGLSKAIDDNSEELGRAGGRLGIAIIKGIVKGLLGGISEVSKAAKDVAKSSLDAAKDFLGINSPAKKAVPIGKGISEGVALGIDKFAHVVEKSSENVGKNALATIRQSLNNMTALATDQIDLQPTIRPVLDLTQVQRDAGTITRILKAQPLEVGATRAGAITASTGFNANIREGDDPNNPKQLPGGVIYNQYNNSPKALSSAEIYRQTKNQLSTTREAVAA